MIITSLQLVDIAKLASPSLGFCMLLAQLTLIEFIITSLQSCFLFKDLSESLHKVLHHNFQIHEFQAKLHKDNLVHTSH